MMFFVIYALAISIFLPSIDAGRILFIPPMISASHKLGLIDWAEKLNERGHEVYWWSPSTTLDNYQPKNVSYIDHFAIDYNTDHMMNDYKRWVWTDEWAYPFFLTSLALQLTPMCETVITNNSDSFRKIASKTYDLIILDEILNPCAFLIAYLTNSPVALYISTCRLTRQSVNFNSVPSPYSYVPSIANMKIVSDRMNFLQRVENNILWWVGQIGDRIFYKQITKRLQKYYPDLKDIRQSVIWPSFQFASMAQMLDFPQPQQRNVVYLGGTIKTKRHTLDDSLKLLIEQHNGFILMATGHWGNWDTAPKGLRESLFTAFNKLPKDILLLWQYKGPTPESLSHNIKLVEWFPQRTLLAHPKCKLLITHCGCNSVSEAVYFGVPVVAMPLNFDQSDAAARLISRRLGRAVRKNNITVDYLYSSITDVLSDQTYETRIKKFSSMIADQITNPLDKAVFWTEFSVRHKNVYKISKASFEHSFLFYFFSFEFFSLWITALLSILLLY